MKTVNSKHLKTISHLICWDTGLLARLHFLLCS